MSLKTNPKYVELLLEAFEKYKNIEERDSNQSLPMKNDSTKSTTVPKHNKDDIKIKKKVSRTNQRRKNTYGFKRNKI